MSNTGWSSNYYKLPEDAKELDDLIVAKEMPWHIANIFKACYRFGSKDGTTKEYDLDKIIWFAQRHKALLQKDKESNPCMWWVDGYAYTHDEYTQIMRAKALAEEGNGEAKSTKG